MRNLPYHDLPLTTGINSFYNPQTVAGGGFSALSNLSGFDEFRSLGVQGGSSKATASVTDNILSCHYFEYTDRDRTRVRKQLYFTDAGGLYVGDASSPSSIKTGITEATTGLRSAVTGNQIYLSSPDLTLVEGQAGLRYDGSNVRNWGVHAPGDEWEEVDTLDSNSGWTDSAAATTSTETANHRYGAGGVRLDKDGTGSTSAYFYKSGQNKNWLDTTRDSFRVFFYMPPDAVDQGFDYVYITFSQTGSFSWRWYYGDLNIGWNELVWTKTDWDASTAGAFTWDDVDYIEFQIRTRNASEVPTGFIFDSFGWVRHDGFPTLAVGAAGALTGDYRYRVTYLAEDGTESNAGPISGTLTLTADKATLTDLPIANDDQVVGRRLYRDETSDAVFKLVTTIPDNTTTTYTDNATTATLGGAVAPLSGDDLLDNTPPTRFSALAVHGGRVFGVDADAPNTVWPSDIGVPGAFPIRLQLTFDDVIVAMVSHQRGLLLYGTDHTYLLTGEGSGSDLFRATQLTDLIGADTYRSVATIRNFNVVVHEKRVYLYEEISEPWYISGPVQDWFNSQTAANLFVVHDPSRTRLLFFVDAGYVAMEYNYGSRGFGQVSPDGPGIDPFDPRGGVWSRLTFPSSYGIRCAMVADSSAEVTRCVVGCDDAKAYYINETTDYSWETTASTEAVAASFTSHAVPIGTGDFENPMAPASTGGRGEPRYVRVDAVGVGATTTWTFTINMLHDPGATAFATENVTVTVPVGQSTLYLPIPAIGERAAYVSISGSSSSSTGRAKFRLIRIHYIPRTRFRGAKES